MPPKLTMHSELKQVGLKIFYSLVKVRLEVNSTVSVGLYNESQHLDSEDQMHMHHG